MGTRTGGVEMGIGGVRVGNWKEKEDKSVTKARSSQERKIIKDWEYW